MAGVFKRRNLLRRDERGIALIFSLLMMGLLLIMAMSFVSNSMFEEKTASNSASSTSAGILAEAALNRVVKSIQAYDKEIVNLWEQTPRVNLGSCQQQPDSSYLQDGLDKLVIENFYGKAAADGYPNLADDKTKNLSWELITLTDASNASRIIGRVAYVVLPCQGIDPGRLVKSGVDEGASPRAEKRIGLTADEVNLRDLYTGINVNIAQKFFNYLNNGAAPAGRFNNSWISLNNMFSEYKSVVPSLPPADKKMYRLMYITASLEDREAFWIDKNDDEKVEHNPDDTTNANNELYNRFNLRMGQTEWDKATCFSDMVMNPDVTGLPDFTKLANVQYPNNPGQMRCIPWLTYFGYGIGGTPLAAVKGTFSDVKYRRYQIIANLVDYCDTDSVATSDQTDWENNYPNYTGNEKTPYLNEAGVMVQTFIEQDTSDLSNQYCRASVDCNLILELINIYGGAAAPVKARFFGSVDVECEFSNGGGSTHSFDLSTANGSTPFPVAGGYTTYKVELLNDLNHLFSSNTSSTDPGTAEIKNVELKLDRIILYDNNDKYIDCVNFKYLKNKGVVDTGAVSSGYYNQWIAFQAKDPRQNLNAEDWDDGRSLCDTGQTPGFNSSVLSISGTFGGALTGQVNTAANPAAAYSDAYADADPATAADPETCTDPAGGTLSTAFIRDGQMVSPWELGFIHRGMAWQTLNLKKYATGRAFKFNKDNPPGCIGDKLAGGTDYYRGDANILDQIKMDDRLKNYKINANTKYSNIIQALIEFIRIDPVNKTSIGDLTSGKILRKSPSAAEEISSNKLINAIASRAGAQYDNLTIKKKFGQGNYYTRANIANDLYFYYNGEDTVPTAFNPGAPDAPFNTIPLQTDAAMEEIIGKFINLTSCSSHYEYYYVILLAQAVKDVGTAAGVNITKIKSGGGSEVKNCKLGVFDELNGVYFDEITGEQKYLALIRRNFDGSCKVVSVEKIFE
ncbi:hypothetical protein P0136_08570 [Lentisphaerota bacterium ZTH]|nr:hypothetical protein JYG24_00325 [Lentisphaerota bacterium]WET05418.1 hypothetical protein P0136_08570 [Lentisphaerota bacterium ZTH]